MSRPSILIADDHQILAEGVRGLVEPEFQVVGVVADGRELLAAAAELQPDDHRRRYHDAVAQWH